MLYGWAIIPLVYTVSFSFKTPGSACVKLVVMLTFLSISPVVLVTVTSEKGKGSHRHFTQSRNLSPSSHSSHGALAAAVRRTRG